MSYTFSSLSPADFEDMTRELVGKKLKVRFEGFAMGPDDGIDGRHAKARKKTILQAKHFLGSSFSSLKNAMKRERNAIERLAPHRYLLATSRPLSPSNKSEIAAVIGPRLKTESDIFGPGDLNSLLREFPEIEKAHIKLWLSSSAVLERVIRSSTHSFTGISRADIEQKVRVYAQNPSFKEARDSLEANHVLIISGPPGVGKTTLGEMLCYAYIGEEWEFIAIRTLDEGFAGITDSRKQIFFFDDFLGKVALDARALASKDSDIARFVRRIQGTKNSRFILTTRAYIFEEARRVSEYLADQKLDIMKYVLDVGVYTRRIRARILYNHLYVSKTPKSCIRALVEDQALISIIDHQNYNPRIIEWMTDAINLRGLGGSEYVRAFLEALENPSRIWDTAFRTHIPPKCRHLLLAMFFCSEYGTDLEDVQLVFDAVHPFFSKKYGHAYDVKDFAEAVKILEGSFIAISGGRISFINPSVRDYLTEYLKDDALLMDFAFVAPTPESARAIWQKAKGQPTLDLAKLARQFVRLAKRFEEIQIWKTSAKDSYTRNLADIPNSERLEVLFEWWEASHHYAFAEAAMIVARGKPDGFTSWLDLDHLLRLIPSLHRKPKNYIPKRDRILVLLDSAIIQLMNSGVSLDELGKIYDAMDQNSEIWSEDLNNELLRSINYEINDASSIVAQIDSESTLNDHIKALQRLGARAGISENDVQSAVEAAEQRIEEIKKDVVEANQPSFTGRESREIDNFDDDAVRALFLPLAN